MYLNPNATLQVISSGGILLRTAKSTCDFVEEINKLTEKFPRGSHYLVDQINRAAISIALNIAEGNGRYHHNDRNNFFYIVHGFVHEFIPLVELVYRKRLITIEIKKELSEKLEVIAKQL